jgi:polysaccharide export outer membrane protein
MYSRLVVLAACVAISGCASKEFGPISTPDGTPSSRIGVVTPGALPAPDRSDLTARDRPYLIGPFDKLVIDLFGVSELSQKEYQIDASGRLSYPLAGTIEAAGKTPAELENEIESRLRVRYIKDPQITINLRETVSQVVTVDGAVRNPGLYPVVGRMTLIRAVATASGLSEFADQSDVVVFRTVNGQKYAALYNLKAIRRGVYDDPEVFANDIVVVGESEARRLFRDLLQLAPVLTTPLVVALQ